MRELQNVPKAVSSKNGIESIKTFGTLPVSGGVIRIKSLAV
jgi:hypothetical protein